MKKIFLYLLIVSSSIVFGQKITFNIENDTAIKKIFITNLSDKVLKSVLEKEDNFTLNYLGLDEGYYLIRKEKHEILVYLKPSDDLKISFDNDDVYNSLVFSGKGSVVNNYLLSRFSDRVNKKGKLTPFYKKKFYEGSEDDFLIKLDKYYKDQYGSLFSRRFDSKFSDDEMKDLQYAYSLDLLKYQDAKKHYKLKDSLQPSSSFLEPLNHIHFENTELYKKYNSYKELTILKWRNDILNVKETNLKEEIFSSIRIKSLQQKVLESLVSSMIRQNPEQTKSVYDLIKNNTKDTKLLLQAKEKYAAIKYKDAQKNLSKFQFSDIDGQKKLLTAYKGKYILIYFWKTYCKACTKNFGLLEDLKVKYADKNIEFVSIALGKESDFLTWKGIIQENEAKEPLLFFEGDNLHLIKTYGLTSVPDYKLFSTKGLPIDDIDINKIDNKTEKILDDILE